MKLKLLSAIVLALAVTMAALVFVVSAHAAPGDFLFQWGARYHFVPYAIDVDAHGNVYVADSDGRIQKFDSDGRFLLSWVSQPGAFGYVPGLVGVAVGPSGAVYAVGGDTIQKFDSGGNFLGMWGGYGDQNGEFVAANGIAVDGNENVFVADTMNNRVQKFDSNGRFLAAWETTDPNQGFVWPVAIAVDSSGFLYVSDLGADKVQKFDNNGRLIAEWGDSGAETGLFEKPWGLTVDQDGYILVTDTGNNRVQKFDSNGNFVGAWGGFPFDDLDYDGFGDIATDADGSIYVMVERHRQIRKLDRNWLLVATWASGGSGDGEFRGAADLALDPAGNVFVADVDNGRIQKFDGSGRFVSAFGSVGSAPGQFRNAEGVAIDAAGTVYVADSGNGRVQKFDSYGNFLTAWGSPQDIGAAQDIAVDRNGYVFVPARSVQSVQKFDPDGRYLATLSIPGAQPGTLSAPFSLATDRDGNLYVGDHDAQIVKFDESGNLLTAWNTVGPEGQTKMPNSLAVDGSGNVYAAVSFQLLEVFDTTGHFRTTWGTEGVGPGQYHIPVGVATDKIGSRVYVTADNSVLVYVGFGVTHFEVSMPASTTAGSSLQLTVKALDADDNLVAGYRGTVHFTSSDPGALLPPDVELSGGIGSFDAVLVSPGEQTITASDKDVASAFGTSVPVTVITAGEPDLRVSIRNGGDFKAGALGTYLIRVRNVGTAATSGTVRVWEQLPHGLKAESISGQGWSCRLKTLTCTRKSPLQPGTSYPLIFLTVKIQRNAPWGVTTFATVSGGGESNTGNDSDADFTRIETYHHPHWYGRYFEPWW